MTLNNIVKYAKFYFSVFLYDNGRLGNLSLAGFHMKLERHYSKYILVSLVLKSIQHLYSVTGMKKENRFVYVSFIYFKIYI